MEDYDAVSASSLPFVPDGIPCGQVCFLLVWLWVSNGWGFPGGSVVKNLPTMQEMWVRYLGREDPLEKEMATHCRILAWEITWTEEPGELQSMGSQKSWTQLRNSTTTTLMTEKIYLAGLQQ